MTVPALFIHIYRTSGRIYQVVKLGERSTAGWGKELPVTERMQFQFLALGLRLERWHEEERAGLATSSGETFIVRTKPENLGRDMRPAGVQRMIAVVGKEGRRVAELTGGLLE